MHGGAAMVYDPAVLATGIHRQHSMTAAGCASPCLRRTDGRQVTRVDKSIEVRQPGQKSGAVYELCHASGSRQQLGLGGLIRHDWRQGPAYCVHLYPMLGCALNLQHVGMAGR